MKMRITWMKTIVVLILAAITALGCSFLSSGRTQAQTPPSNTVRVSFGSVGVTTGQTLRFNVVNAGLIINPCVRVLLNFRDSNNQLLRNARGEVIRKLVTIEPQESAFLDLNTDHIQFPSNVSRLQIRAVATVQQVDDGVGVSPSLQTVEVINNANGRTQFVVFGLPAVQDIQSPPADE